jgi:predicted Zn-dependent protease
MRFSDGRRGALAAALLAVLASGCADATRLDPHISLPDPPKKAESVGSAQREHQRILAAYGGDSHDSKLESLIAKTVDRLAAASERPDLQYKVTILNSPAVNAFALPSGQLYVTRGMLALANDTAELASVLAHEMAHVIARHAAIREEQVRQAALVNHVASDLFNDPHMSAMALAKNKMMLASFSRGQELEADSIGIGISSRAGFDAFGAVRFLTAMERNAELKSAPRNADPRHLDFLSSHPATPERVRIAQANARQYAAPEAERDKASYLASLDGLVYGEDPSEGFVRGRRFLHPRLGFTFTAPKGFSLENTSQAVLGVVENGNDALRLDVVHVPSEQTLSQYITSGWIENIVPSSVEELTINGFPAATAIAKGEQWSFRAYAVRFGSEVYRIIFATKRSLADADREFRESVGTFRRMALAEIEIAKPLRVQIITAKAGDTAELLAGRMASLDHPLERFLVLNNLQLGRIFKGGEQLKIVAG